MWIQWRRYDWDISFNNDLSIPKNLLSRYPSTFSVCCCSCTSFRSNVLRSTVPRSFLGHLEASSPFATEAVRCHKSQVSAIGTLIHKHRRFCSKMWREKWCWRFAVIINALDSPQRLCMSRENFAAYHRFSLPSNSSL